MNARLLRVFIIRVYMTDTGWLFHELSAASLGGIMAESRRVLYRRVQGTVRRNFNWGAINLDSAVIITAAEFSFAAVSGGQKTLGRPNLGAAPVYVTNVGPHGGFNTGEAGGVEFLLHVDFGSPLDVVVTITVDAPIESFDQG